MCDGGYWATRWGNLGWLGNRNRFRPMAKKMKMNYPFKFSNAFYKIQTYLYSKQI
jgi:hypothetical protein